MVRIKGPAVEALAVTFLADWEIETGVGIDVLRKTGDVQQLPPQGSSNLQVVPSGPGGMPQAIFDMLLTTIYSARTELIMTTPYFLPGEAMLTAIKSAAHRGVDVTIIVPARVDSPLVRLASRSSFEELLAAGVHIKRFRGGLLHSKTVSVDGEFGLIGSVNLDMRSFWLNFEVTLFVYDPHFASILRQTQTGYVGDSEAIDLQSWRERPVSSRLMENIARLLSPLL
jgi:cardiolipin synthase